MCISKGKESVCLERERRGCVFKRGEGGSVCLSEGKESLSVKLTEIARCVCKI